MGEKQTRVNLYTELRNQIDRMDTYSFDDKDRDKKYSSSSIPIIHEEAMTNSEIKTEHIKKNTLSISIDELIKQHDEYTSSFEKKELNKKYKEVKRRKKSSSKKAPTFLTSAWFFILCGVTLIGVIILCLYIGGIL